MRLAKGQKQETKEGGKSQARRHCGGAANNSNVGGRLGQVSEKWGYSGGWTLVERFKGGGKGVSEQLLSVRREEVTKVRRDLTEYSRRRKKPRGLGRETKRSTQDARPDVRRARRPLTCRGKGGASGYRGSSVPGQARPLTLRRKGEGKKALQVGEKARMFSFSSREPRKNLANRRKRKNYFGERPRRWIIYRIREKKECPLLRQGRSGSGGGTKGEGARCEKPLTPRTSSTPNRDRGAIRFCTAKVLVPELASGGEKVGGGGLKGIRRWGFRRTNTRRM